MRRIAVTCASGLLLLCLSTETSRADYLLTPYGFVLQGKVAVQPGGLVVLTHELGKVNFYLNQVRFIRVPTTRELFRQQLARAQKQDADAVFQAARWALKHGLLEEFYEGVEATLAADASHERANRLLVLREQLRTPAKDAPQEVAKVREMLDHDMKTRRSDHFVLLYDTTEQRAERRLELLERVYESFMMFFAAQGVRLERPEEVLRVVLFDQYDDFKAFAVTLSPALQLAAGFFDKRRNVSVFFAWGTDENWLRLKDDFERARREYLKHGRNAVPKEVLRLYLTLELLLDVALENQDIEVVSHEATHQMAGNTGLFPNDVYIPKWAHEGLATYVEHPKSATWSGIGAVNDTRLAWYRALENDRVHSNIDFVVGDEIFDLAASHGAMIHAYGQSWALTHYLMERYPEKLFEYYRLIGQLPPDMVFSPHILRRCFDEAFGSDRRRLDVRWRSHMKGLKTDLAKAIENAED